MMKRDGHRDVVVIALVLVCLAGAGAMNSRLVHVRDSYELTLSVPAAESGESVSPVVAFTTVALGAVRGLVVDLLWARMTTLQQDRQDFVEVVQLSKWITRLEPRLAEVWDYHSFNMAFNIAGMFTKPVDRWRWVLNGIRLLRDEALVYNPRSAVLYDRLCRLYGLKMVDDTDPYCGYYRFAWAKYVADVLRTGRPDYATLPERPGQATRLRKEYKLDPDLMRELDDRYGPFDWRLPEPHIVYWASRGSRHGNTKDNGMFDAMICGSVAESVRRGEIVDFDTEEQVLLMAPRMDLLPKAIATYEAAVDKYEIDLDENDGFTVAYRNFLRAAVLLLHDRQRHDEARELVEMLADRLHDMDAWRPYYELIAYLRSAPELETPITPLMQEMIRMRGAHHHHHHHE